jgi:hypothetical protein
MMAALYSGILNRALKGEAANLKLLLRKLPVSFKPELSLALYSGSRIQGLCAPRLLESAYDRPVDDVRLLSSGFIGGGATGKVCRSVVQ